MSIPMSTARLNMKKVEQARVPRMTPWDWFAVVILVGLLLLGLVGLM